MSTTRKIEVYLSQQALADAGKSKCYFNATPQQNRTVCTLIIGGKAYTQEEHEAEFQRRAKAMLRKLIDKSYSTVTSSDMAFIDPEAMTGIKDILAIFKDEGIKLP